MPPKPKRTRARKKKEKLYKKLKDEEAKHEKEIPTERPQLVKYEGRSDAEIQALSKSRNTTPIKVKAKKRNWQEAFYDHIGPSTAPKEKRVRYKSHIFNQSVNSGR